LDWEMVQYLVMRKTSWRTGRMRVALKIGNGNLLNMIMENSTMTSLRVMGYYWLPRGVMYGTCEAWVARRHEGEVMLEVWGLVVFPVLWLVELNKKIHREYVVQYVESKNQLCLLPRFYTWTTMVGNRRWNWHQSTREATILCLTFRRHYCCRPPLSSV
jgi:hypothetical protein